MPNPYYIPLNPHGELGMLIHGEANKKKQGTATFVLKLLLEHYKKEFIKEYSQKRYDELHEIYSRSFMLQKKLKNDEERRRIKKMEEKLEIRKRELTIREKNAEIRKQQNPDSKTSLKLEIAKCERKIKEAQENFNDGTAQYWARRKKDTEGKLADLKEVTSQE